MTDILAEPVKPPQSMQMMKQFLETQDLSLLDKPLIFSKKGSAYADYLFCRSLGASLPNLCIPCLFCPIGMCCTSKLVPHVDMQLDNHAVKVNQACNDCCFHIRTEKKTIPLDKIQDVQVDQGCVETCFGLKILSILTGGLGNETAAFLENPDEVRTAIMLAVRLSKGSASGGVTSNPSITNSMGGAPRSMSQRLACLDRLVQRRVLTQDEVMTVRVQILAAETDLTQVLLEAADLRDSQRISPSEFDSLKNLLLARLNCALDQNNAVRRLMKD